MRARSLAEHFRFRLVAFLLQFLRFYQNARPSEVLMMLFV